MKVDVDNGIVTVDGTVVADLSEVMRTNKELVETVELLSQIPLLGTKSELFGGMSAIEAVQKIPDVAVDIIIDRFTRTGYTSAFEYTELLYKIETRDALITKLLRYLKGVTIRCYDGSKQPCRCPNCEAANVLKDPALQQWIKNI